MANWQDDRVGAALRGENPLVMARMSSGFAVIGDTQHLPGYSLLLTDDPSANHLTDLDWTRRRNFLFDLSLIGEAVEQPVVHLGCGASTTTCSATGCPSSTDTSIRGTTGNRPTRSRGRCGAIPKKYVTHRNMLIPTRSTESCERR